MMTTIKYKFYDTSSLLLIANNLTDEQYGKIIISSITLNELENIKTALNKDADVKYAARKVLHILDENPDLYEIVIFTENMLKPINDRSLPVTDDMKILASAIWCNDHTHIDDLCFITNDISLKCIANLFFGTDSIASVDEDFNDYDGYAEVSLDAEQLAYFYSNPHTNIYGLYINEYLIIRDQVTNEIIDSLKWTGENYSHLTYKSFNSTWFGDIKPMKGDIYQSLAADSLINNKITMIKGPGGAGKTLLSLAYLFSLLDKGKLSKIIVFCNTVATKNSAKLGYYPGTRDEKLLDSQIGNLLSSKIGSKGEVQRLIDEGKLILLPLSDIRGYDTNDMNAGIYISEAQNMDISLMKLALQRIGNDCIAIIDGDFKTQVDCVDFGGSNSGMRRASKIFRGQNIYGEVSLKMIHRSEIARLAELM